MKFGKIIKSKKFCRTALGLWFCALLFLASAFQIEAQSKRKNVKPKLQTATVQVKEDGYLPSSFRLKLGVPARLIFVRRTKQTCATEVVFPDLGIRRELPLNKSIVIKFTPNKRGKFTFACGMNMVRGTLVVQ
jgi:plastocyanin domain-containing protein